MSSKKIFILIFAVFPLLLFSQAQKKDKYLPESERIFVTAQRTDAKTQAAKSDWKKRTKLEEITFVVRMPSSWTKEKDAAAKESKIPCVRGVIAICTWHKDVEMLKKNLSYWDSPYKYLIQFADENNLAVMTWANFGGYTISTSSDEMTEKQAQNYEFMFNDRLSGRNATTNILRSFYWVFL